MVRERGRLDESSDEQPVTEERLDVLLDRHDLDEPALRHLGLSTAKARVVRRLALLQTAGDLDVDGLGDLSDEDAVAALTSARGVGPWTAQTFLIHRLRRPDVLPAGDLGIRHAIQRLLNHDAVPDIDSVRDHGARWAPYRTYAAALLWASLGNP